MKTNTDVTFEKEYIGKGKFSNEDFGIVAVSICIDDAKKHFFVYKDNGKRYLKFEVAPRKNPDNYGNTHNVYVNKMIKPEAPKGKEKTKG